MDCTVAVRTDEKALVQLVFDGRPGSRISFCPDPERLLAVLVVEDQCIKAAIIPTKTTAIAFVLNYPPFQLLAPLCDVKLSLAPLTAETPLPTGQNCATRMPDTTSRNSRLLYH